ncbi:hypothetical protein [Acinetobacter terrae]|uniref:hypothetical protein n=1 Tax=Acinetobacter terrae TaxID=2731247 RepID=UPI0007D785F6|nr:hypothetical protein [Acinetobacter terrae]OAL75923.1 hypothetical protein AY608_09585 [Acinetobacter terrae]
MDNNVRLLESTIKAFDAVLLLVTKDELSKYSNIEKLHGVLRSNKDILKYKLVWDDKPNIEDIGEVANKYIKDNKTSDLIALNEISGKILKSISITEQFNEVMKNIKDQDIQDIKEIVLLKNVIEKFDFLENEYHRLEERRQNIEELNIGMLASQKEAQRIVDELKDKNEAFNQLIDDKSNAEIKTLYEKIYDDEIKLADKYRNWALLIFVVIGAFLLLGFLNLSIQNWNHLRDSSYIHIPFGWDSLLKTLMLFSLTTPAWYLTRESSKHRKVAYKAKMLGTELASFPLYAREFKDEDRLELRKSLADRFFGQELYNGSSNVKNTNDVSIEQIKLIAEANKILAESLKMKQNLS